MPWFKELAPKEDESMRYGRFGVAPDFPYWEVYAWRIDLHKWQYTGLKFYRKITAMKVAQAMFLAEKQHWGSEL